MQDLVSFWILATISLAMGMMLNQLRDEPLPLLYETKAERLDLGAKDESVASQLQLPSQDLSLLAFKELVNSKGGVILDARPEVYYRSGHVPGALSLPRVDFDAAFARLRNALDRDSQQSIVIYCSGQLCEDSRLVQAALVKRGYKHVLVFSGGWPAWSNAHLPEEKAL